MRCTCSEMVVVALVDDGLHPRALYSSFLHRPMISPKFQVTSSNPREWKFVVRCFSLICRIGKILKKDTSANCVLRLITVICLSGYPKIYSC